MKAALLFTFFLCLGAQVGAEILPVASVLKNSTVLHQCNAFFYTSKSLITTATCVGCRDCQFHITLQTGALLGEKVYQIAKVVIHPNYTNDPIAYNVAKLILDEEVPGAIVLDPVRPEDLAPANGTFYSWRYSDLMEFKAYPNNATYISRVRYYKATKYHIRDHELSIQTHVNVPIGPYDEGTPFIVQRDGFKSPLVYGYFPRPRIQKPGKFFSIMSIPFLFDDFGENFFYDFTTIE